MKIHIWTDGSCSGNPGPGAAAARIVCTPEGGKPQTLLVGRYSTLTTNNAMEMGAVVLALLSIQRAASDAEVVIHSDSQLVVCTINDGWKRKKNLAIWELIDKLSARFSNLSWVWIPREQNGNADKIAREVCEKGMRGEIKPGLTIRRIIR